MKISIIVPVYNSQAYAAECFYSIQAQTYKDWECICVDDGSTDESMSIIKNFSNQDSRFTYIQQQNGGPGAARNAGLENANGDFFTFVDSDDLVHPKMLEIMLKLSQSHAADLVVCNYFSFISNDEFTALIQDQELLSDQTEVRKPPQLSEMVDWKKYRVHPFCKLYQSELHGKLRFPLLYGAEDDYVSFDVYGRSKCAVFSSMKLYGYRMVETGLVRSLSKYRNYILGDAQVAMHAEELCREHGLDRDVRAKLISRYVMRMFGYLNEMSTDSRLTVEQKKKLMAFARDGLQDIIQQVKGRYQIVPLVHSIPYAALRLRSLQLLIIWQWIRINLLRKGAYLLKEGRR